MQKCSALNGLVCLALAGALVSDGGRANAAPRSEFPETSRGDVALAAAAKLGKEKGVEAEGQELLKSLRGAGADDPQMDAVRLRLARFATTRPVIREALLEQASAQQLLRLGNKCEELRDYPSQLLFADGLLEKAPASPEAPEAANMSARAHMLVDDNETEALRIWEQTVSRWPSSKEALRAQIYLEAVRGPNSIAALEACHDIGKIQSRVLGNPVRALLSHSRILEAVKRPFFQEFLASPAATATDKAELLYIVLTHAHLGGRYDEVPGYAGQILSLVEPGSRLAERASFAIALSLQMRGLNREAAAAFVDFMVSYPKSPDASRACLYCAQAYDSDKDKANALVYFGVLMQLYPSSREFQAAKTAYQAIIDSDPSGIWLADATEAKERAVASVSVEQSPEAVWAKWLNPPAPERTVAVDGATSSPELQLAAASVSAPTDPRLQRLSERLNAR